MAAVKIKKKNPNFSYLTPLTKQVTLNFLLKSFHTSKCSWLTKIVSW